MDEAVSLRRGFAADADEIAALTQEAYSKWIAVMGCKPSPMTVDYHAALRAHRFDLLHIGNRIVGLIETVPDEPFLLIVNVAVRPGFQGRGLGERLLSLAEDIAAGQALSGIRLYTNALMTENIRLYERLGYRREREELRNVGIAVYMTKPLPAG